MTQEALKLALEGVEIHSPNSPEYIVCAALIEALRENAMREVQRLGQEIEQEPVAWMHPDGRLWTFGKGFDKSTFTIPLYTAPPQRTWVGLTDEEKKDLCRWWSSPMDAIYATEAKLKEKNRL